jgi:hypothetical protein
VNGIRNDHDIIYSGIFKNADEIEMDWDVPNADTGIQTWARVPYTGSTEQAVITADNALSLAVGSWLSGETGGGLNILGAAQPLEESSAMRIGPLGISSIIEQGLLQADFNFPKPVQVMAVVDVDETMGGSCGGSAMFDGTGDDQTGEISGTFTFSNYCEEGIIINGRGELYGKVDLFSDEVVFLHFIFTDMNVLFGNESVTLDGRIRVNYLTSPPFMLLSYVYADNNLGVSYWLKDLIVDMVEGFDYVDFTDLMGRYYDPDHGYVEVEIDEPIRIYDDDLWPASGKFILVGAEGNQGGNTKASLEFLSETSFLVEADTDGDGVYDDYSSGPRFWSEL